VSGPVPAAQVPDLVAGARAVLVPSAWPEPAVPRAVLEAYASRVAVVTSAVGGMREGVREGETGYLVPPGDVDAWVGALRRLRREGEAERLGDGGFTVWRERYGPDAGLRALEAAYAEAIAR
jgi:glycosyltransferase involved in cell wall biosynthesis